MSVARIQNGTLYGTPIDDYDKVYIKDDDLTINSNLASQASFSGIKSVSLPQYYAVIYNGRSTSFFDLSVGNTYTYSLKLTTPAAKKARARVQFYTDESNRDSLYGNYINAGETGYSYVTFTLTSAQKAYAQMQLCIDCNDGTTTTDTCYYSKVKLELGSKRTPWLPNEAGEMIATSPVEAVDFIEK